MSGEETAFISVQCVEREASSDSRSLLLILSFPSTPLSLMCLRCFFFYVVGFGFFFLNLPIKTYTVTGAQKLKNYI